MLTKEQLTELGRITVSFSELELVIGSLLSYQFDTDPWIGKIVCSQLSFDRCVKVLDALIRYRCKDEELLERFDLALKRASEAEQRRNALIHSYWFTSLAERGGRYEEQATRMKISLKKGEGMRFQEEDFSAEEIAVVAQLAEEATAQLVALNLSLARAGLLKGWTIIDGKATDAKD